MNIQRITAALFGLGIVIAGGLSGATSDTNDLAYTKQSAFSGTAAQSTVNEQCPPGVCEEEEEE